MKTRSSFPNQIVVKDPEFIELSDGTRLAVRVWLPVDANDQPVPNSALPASFMTALQATRHGVRGSMGFTTLTEHRRNRG